MQKLHEELKLVLAGTVVTVSTPSGLMGLNL